VVGIVASLAAIAAPPAAFAGLVPRLGPMRAIVLALSTRFRRVLDVSQRANEVHTLSTWPRMKERPFLALNVRSPAI